MTCGTIALAAQQKEGRVTYERSIEINITMRSDVVFNTPPPQTNVSTFELNFAGNIVSWKQQQEVLPDDPSGNIRVITVGSDGTNWFNLGTGLRLQQTELGGKNYLVSDSIRNGNWKLTDDSKTILGHACRKAVSTVIGKRSIAMMENGKMERREIADTSLSEAWFTSDIPVSAGPEIQGQLPGLILELSTRGGRIHYMATGISPKADTQALKEPTRGKKTTAPEFAKERTKLMEQMQGPGGAGGTRVTFTGQ